MKCYTFNIMIPNFQNFSNKNQGSSSLLPAHGRVGARATSLLAAHFALRNTASNSAEKKGSPSEGVAEGGGWGEEFRHARAFRRAKRGGYVRFRFLDLCIRFGKMISKACPVGSLLSCGAGRANTLIFKK